MTSHPYDILELPSGTKLVFTPCPGTKGVGLDDSLSQLTEAGASVLITMMPSEEMIEVGVGELPRRVQAMGLCWHHFPVEDDQAPGAEFEQAWRRERDQVLQDIARKEGGAIHCKGGSGRTGLMASVILRQLGISGEEADAMVRPRKLAEGTELFGRVHNMLRYRQWSPEQIAEQLKLRHPDDPAMRGSHETIYAAIYAYPKNELRRVFIEQLRQAKPKRGRRSTATQYATIQVPDSLTIHQRDEQIETRQLAGHWEGDLIVGKLNQSCIGTVVERKTGFLVLCKMENKSARSVREGFERQMKKIDPNSVALDS